MNRKHFVAAILFSYCATEVAISADAATQKEPLLNLVDLASTRGFGIANAPSERFSGSLLETCQERSRPDKVNNTASQFARNAEAYRSAAACLRLYRRQIQDQLISMRSVAAPAASALRDIDATVQFLEAIDRVIAAADDGGDGQEASNKFMNLSWGVGFGISYGFDRLITEASVDDGGILRAKVERRQEPRVVLEFHSFGWFSGKKEAQTATRARTGYGPFVAVVADDEDVLQGVGFGWMYGRATGEGTDGKGFSVALGAILDRGVRGLPKSFEIDQPLPPGESLRYIDKSRWSALLFVTRTF